MSLPSQAIGRVHRLGQKREVEVVRLLVKDSVETRIRAFLKHKYSASNDVDNANIVGPLGNQATEKNPMTKIVTAEFDILFGVESEDAKMEEPGENVMPDVASSSFSI